MASIHCGQSNQYLISNLNYDQFLPNPDLNQGQVLPHWDQALDPMGSPGSVNAGEDPKVVAKTKQKSTHTHTRTHMHVHTHMHMKLRVEQQVWVQGGSGGTNRSLSLDDLLLPSLPFSKIVRAGGWGGERTGGGGSSSAFRKAEHATTHIHTSRN